MVEVVLKKWCRLDMECIHKHNKTAITVMVREKLFVKKTYARSVKDKRSR